MMHCLQLGEAWEPDEVVLHVFWETVTTLFVRNVSINKLPKFIESKFVRLMESGDTIVKYRTEDSEVICVWSEVCVKCYIF